MYIDPKILEEMQKRQQQQQQNRFAVQEPRRINSFFARGGGFTPDQAQQEALKRGFFNTQAEADAYEQQQRNARNIGLGNMLYSLSDAFAGRNIGAEAQQRQANMLAMQQAQEQRNQRARQEQQRVSLNQQIDQLVLSGQMSEAMGEYAKSDPSILGEIYKSQLPSQQKAPTSYQEYALTDDTPTSEEYLKYIDRNEEKPAQITPQNPLGLSKKDLFDRTDKLSDDFRSDADVKDFVKSVAGMGKILDSAEKASPAGDIAMVFNFMKVLDPSSVVRESEYQTAAGAAELMERMGFSQDKIDAVRAGEVLTPTQRNDFLNTALNMYETQKDNHELTKAFYTNRAKRSGLNPDDIIFDYEGSLRPKIEKAYFRQDLSKMTAQEIQELDSTQYTEEQKKLIEEKLKELLGEK
tara:strand:- start:1224 stop:2450 length:1227 start_codon:yes stop_codon:yes gene_type:complete